MGCPLGPPRKSYRLLSFLAFGRLPMLAHPLFVPLDPFSPVRWEILAFLPHLVRAIIFFQVSNYLSSILALSPRALSRVLNLVSRKNASPLLKLCLSKFILFSSLIRRHSPFLALSDAAGA